MAKMTEAFGFGIVRAVVLAGCVAAAAVPAMAQSQDAPPPPPAGHGMHHDGPEQQARMLKRMTRELNLTPDQVTQVQAIQADEASKMQALNADTSDAGHGRHQQVKAIHEDGQARTRALLTDDQKTKFDAMEAHMKEHEHERGQRSDGGNTPPPPPPSL